MTGRRGAVRALGALALVAAAAAPASADPVLGDVAASSDRTGTLTVTVDAAFARRGRVAVQGTVNGRRVRARKKVRAGLRTTTIRLSARRAGVRAATGPLAWDLTVVAQEKGVATERPLTARTAVPVIVLPGFLNETTPGSLDAFAASLDAEAGGAWGAGAKKSAIAVHGYDSRGVPLDRLAKDLDRRAKTILRGSPFRRVDVVGYSLGGIVARRWIAGRGKGRVRRLVFLGTPNEGAPVATLGLVAARSGLLDTLLASGGIDLSLLGLGSDLVDEDTLDALEVFTPTYAWVTVFGFPFDLAGTFGGVTSVPLEALNAVAPDPALESVVAFAYTAALPAGAGLPAGTVDRVDGTQLLDLQSGGLDFTNPELINQLASGDGDGVVPAHSVWMDEVPAWSGSPKFEARDLGTGTHVTMTLDSEVVRQVVEVLTR